MNGYIENKADLRKRLSRVEGQVRGISRMVDDDEYCIDTLTQVAAAKKALETVALSLLSDHLSHCVAQASAEGGEVAAQKVREANAAILAWSVHNHRSNHLEKLTMTDRIELGLKDANAGCACCAAPSNTEASTRVTAAVSEDVLVTGMTCSHCVSSVSEELSALDGVASVSIDLNAGGSSRVTIDRAAPVDPAAVRAAVEEAGYSLATSQA